MRNIVTGVIHNNSAAWLHDDIYQAIDLDWRTHCADCPIKEHESHDDCWENVGGETMLIGFMPCGIGDPAAWFNYIGKHGSFAFMLDESAEYSAICCAIYTQIVRSRWVAECNKCSPCYPNQGDLDTPGTDYLAYCLPPDMFDTDIDGFDVSRIKEAAS